jgi:hypothetical protein
MGALSAFAGTYLCAGKFANGTPISSTVRFDLDLGGAAIVKHHDDTSPPALYHAVEVWTYQPKEHRFLASITDNFGGVRELTSPGLEGSKLTWTSGPAVKPKQQFVYTKADDGIFTLDWRVEDPHKGWVVGDTLTCQRI